MSLEGVADYKISKLHGAVAWVYTGCTIANAALARRFQPVLVSEPSLEDTIFILRGLKEIYEVHHGVRISDGTIVSAATPSNCYITDRFMPDKAIDLIDEYASRLHMEVDSKPGAIDELDRGIIRLQIEHEALRKETDKVSRDRRGKLEADFAKLEKKEADLPAIWQLERGKIERAQDQGRTLSGAGRTRTRPARG